MKECPVMAEPMMVHVFPKVNIFIEEFAKRQSVLKCFSYLLVI